ncbi:MAG: GxxExxY protein [Saprospiraceae bacterium]|nr:GxxExxY protein [Saprospiraceae bacterium]
METTTKKKVNDLTRLIIGAAIEVHKILGPGLLEKVYEAALMHELRLRGLKVVRQQAIIVNYKGVDLDCELRYDLLVEDLIICELKSTREMHPIFDATLISYMKHLEKPKGILINFHVRNIYYEGQKTFVNEYFSALPEG